MASSIESGCLDSRSAVNTDDPPNSSCPLTPEDRETREEVGSVWAGRARQDNEKNVRAMKSFCM